MDRIVLDQITRVYRFTNTMKSWVREGAADHFIAYKLSGCSIHERNGEVYPFRRDTVMVANQKDFYSVTQSEVVQEERKGGCIAVHFTTAQPFEWHFSMFNCSGNPLIKSAFFKMLDAWNQFRGGRPEAEYACIARFYEICGYLIELRNDRGGEDDRLEKARAFLERNISNSILSITEVADFAQLSQRRFSELFMDRYGRTPGRFLTECRMQHAEELLDQPDLTISEIASLSGYADTSYFIRVFRREFGTSPNAYRKQNENRK